MLLSPGDTPHALLAYFSENVSRSCPDAEPGVTRVTSAVFPKTTTAAICPGLTAVRGLHAAWTPSHASSGIDCRESSASSWYMSPNRPVAYRVTNRVAAAWAEL